jgi:hypothetical protein
MKIVLDPIPDKFMLTEKFYEFSVQNLDAVAIDQIEIKLCFTNDQSSAADYAEISPSRIPFDESGFAMIRVRFLKPTYNLCREVFLDIEGPNFQYVTTSSFFIVSYKLVIEKQPIDKWYKDSGGQKSKQIVFLIFV